MKKLIFIIVFFLTLSSCANTCNHEWIDTGDGLTETCTLCENIQNKEDKYKMPLSYEEWQIVQDKSNFNNYTLDVKNNLQGYQISTMKITSDNVSMSSIIDGQLVLEETILDEFNSTFQKEFYAALFSNFLNQYDSFKYNYETKMYFSDDEIKLSFVTNINDNNTNYSIKMKNIEFELDSSNKLKYLKCFYTEITESEIIGNNSISLDVEFNLSNYNTTIINVVIPE